MYSVWKVGLFKWVIDDIVLVLTFKGPTSTLCQTLQTLSSTTSRPPSKVVILTCILYSLKLSVIRSITCNSNFWWFRKIYWNRQNKMVDLLSNLNIRKAGDHSNYMVGSRVQPIRFFSYWPIPIYTDKFHFLNRPIR